MMIRIRKLLDRAKGSGLFLVAAGAFTVVAAAIVTCWWRTHPGISAPGRISALVSVLLFSFVCIRFLRHWISDWQTTESAGDERRSQEKISAVFLVKVFLSLLALDAAAVLFVYILRIALKGQASFPDSLEF